MQSPPHEEAKPQQQAGLRAGQQLCREASVHVSAHQDEQKPARCPCGKPGQQLPELHQECCQQLERWSFLSAQHWQGHISRFPSISEGRMCWSELNKKAQKENREWIICSMGRSWESWDSSAWSREGLWGLISLGKYPIRGEENKEVWVRPSSMVPSER